MKPINVLSLFNGISCGRIALERAGIPVANYYESEIDKYANIVSAYNWPESVQVGDVRNVKVSDLPFVPELLIAGSPCQGFSFAGKQLNFNDPRSALFFEFVRILKECIAVNPDVLFMLENVPMKKEYQRVINEALGVFAVEINGALVSAQNRNRIFWTNIRTKTIGFFGDVYTDIPQPQDKGVLLADILESEVDEKYFLSEKALARIERNTYSQAKINPDKTGTITTKNNSGQLSIDSGTTLIGVVNDNGNLREVSQANCIDASYAKGVDNHGQRTLAVVVHNMLPRSSTNGRGGTGHLTMADGKTYCHDRSSPNAVEILGSGGAVGTAIRRQVKNGRLEKRIEHRKDEKANCVTQFQQLSMAQCVSMRGRHLDENGNRVDIRGADTVQRIEPAVSEGKTNCVTSVQKDNLIKEGVSIRRLTPTEVCRLFTIPDNYFHDKDGKRLVSESQQYKALGNGWIVDVIAHIFSFIPRDTKLQTAKKKYSNSSRSATVFTPIRSS
jgi:DNA-cytosine methyltransferase